MPKRFLCVNLIFNTVSFQVKAIASSASFHSKNQRSVLPFCHKMDGVSLINTPAQGFIGTNKFTYTTTDGLNVSNTATVTITVSSPGSNGNGGNTDQDNGGSSGGGGSFVEMLRLF